ncbi:MAG TPA: AsmA family protein, partial [Candidatus Omnitrophota bacterium]|nr:AsmA family protein [Candidatus Omnitrophota bacterium]
MKILKIIFISLFILLLIAGTALFIFIKTFDVQRFKPQIIEAMNQALGRQADFKDIRLQLSLPQGLGLGLKQFTIKDDPFFSTGELLKIENISIGIDVLDYFSKKQITISRIQIEAPQLTIIRSKEGEINVSTLGKQPSRQSATNSSLSFPNASVGNPDTATTRPPTKTFGGDNSTQSALNLPEIIIHTIDVHNANITYIDKSFDPSMTVDISKLDIKISGFSLKDPFSFNAEGSLFSADKNFRVDGTGVLNLENQGIQFKNINISSDLSLLSFAKLQSSVSTLKGVEMPQQLSGKLNLKINHLELGAKGLGPLLAQGELNQGNLKFKQLALPLEIIEGKFQVTESKINLSEFSTKLGRGSVSVTGKLEDYLGKQNFSADMKLDSIDLSEILEQKDQPVKVAGVVQGNFQMKGQGFTAEELRQFLSGSGNLEVKNGRLKDINILKMVLNNISMLPGLADKIEENLPQNYKDKLTQKDTILNKAVLTTSLQNGVIVIQPAEIEADGFLFSAQGKAGFDQSYSLDGSFFIFSDLSATMVSGVEELEYFLDDQKRIYIPLKIT